MTFGKKLKQLRTANQLTQDALTEKLFVSRTAVSKWETDRGFPDIENLKAIAALFEVSIDDLISDEDVCNLQLLQRQRARRMYWASVAFLAAAAVSVLLFYFLRLPALRIVGGLGSLDYLVCGLLSKPKYKRMDAKRLLLPYVLSRLAIRAVIVAVLACSFR